MNNVADFVKDLSQQNVELWVEGDKLRYRAPKEALNSTILNQIKQYKRTIIDLLRKNVDTSKSFPLSYGQQGIWFLYKLAPHTPAYNIAFTARIRSHLNIAALQRALQTLIARHPSLRTTFGQLDAEPFQEVHQYREICIETIDASRWDDSQLRDNAIAAYKRPFDLETGNVIRVNLFTRSPEEYVLILTIHHIAVDGFSFGILLNELRLLYEAENNGSALSLAPVNYSYKDFVQWQNKMLKSPVGDNLSTYWQKQFSGELPLLNIPTDRPRLPVQNYRGACYSFEITNELACKLREIGRGEGATLYMTLLAAFQVLLYRYTGQEDVIVVSPVEGRSKAEFDNIVGFFVNMFPVRVNLAGNPSFIEFLSQVRKTVLTALTNQDYPSTLLLEQLRLNREPSLIGLFPASFNLLKVDEIVPEYELSVSNKTTITKDWAGLKLEPFAIPQQEGQNDLIFDVVETKESLIATFRYSTDLFDETTIKRMVENLQTLLEGIVSNPLSRVASLPMLSQVERNLLKDWNNNRVESPSATSLLIHQLFEDRANKTPNAIAVSFEGQQLTYQELNLRANQLARYLRGLGVKPEMLVGICVERSLDMVVGLLGILKAGGAYVPLDPNYPPERLSYMLTDSGVEVLLTQQSLLGYLPSHAAKVVCIDRDWVTIEQQDGDNFNAVVKQDNLAYIIYTSGSTGKPKGVMISHQALSCFIQSAISEYNITASDRILQFASINFDTAVEEIYPCLCTGATLILRSNEMLADLQKFFQTCADLQLTVLDLPTAYWHQLVADLASSNIALPESLRLVIIGGEKVLPEPVRCWQEYIAKSGKSNNLQLINTYGPTETTVSSTLYRIGNSTSGEAAEVPIGRPLAHSQAYILDKNLQQVPIGVPGELYIGGNTLARGYLNRPEFTKEKFIQNPFSNSSSNSKSQRLYKTGDLVRYLPDGNITFIGRIDNQVKVRGFRMELGEIETVLNSHPQIQQAIVIVHEDIPGEKSLVAYLVLNQSLTIGKLREFIRKKLPDYMVPNAFITLDTLPLTPNGKIDRKALPAGNEKITREQEYVAPRSHGEEIIANIFANLLNVQNVGIHDNFFYLGGHSLLATQLISRLREAFSLEIPLRTLFEYPTVAELEAKLTSLQTTSSGFTLPPVEPRNRNQELHLSWAQ
ncbi:MAG: amino acid adenylation domain-containing protein, partial [Cyanobacteria bacterium J06633_8]